MRVFARHVLRCITPMCVAAAEHGQHCQRDDVSADCVGLEHPHTGYLSPHYHHITAATMLSPLLKSLSIGATTLVIDDVTTLSDVWRLGGTGEEGCRSRPPSSSQVYPIPDSKVKLLPHHVHHTNTQHAAEGLVEATAEYLAERIRKRCDH